MDFLIHFPLLTTISVIVVAFVTLGLHVYWTEKTVADGPTILTTLGIFFTFLGIALGLLDFDTANIQASVPSLLEGLKTAFWASVFGVLGALTIKIRAFIKHRDETIHHESEITAREFAEILKSIESALIGENKSSVFSQLKSSQNAMNTRLDRLQEAQQEFSIKHAELECKTSIENLRQEINKLNGLLASVPETLRLWQDEYKGQIEEMKKAQQEMTKTRNTSFNNLTKSVDKFNKDIKDNVELLTKSSNQLLNQSLQTLGAQLTALSEKFVSDYTPLTEKLRHILEIAEKIDYAPKQDSEKKET